jgi:hypothetical protein
MRQFWGEFSIGVTLTQNGVTLSLSKGDGAQDACCEGGKATRPQTEAHPGTKGSYNIGRMQAQYDRSVGERMCQKAKEYLSNFTGQAR